MKEPYSVYAETPDGQQHLLGTFETPHEANKFALGVKYTLTPHLILLPKPDHTGPLTWRWKIITAMAIIADLICAPFVRER